MTNLSQQRLAARAAAVCKCGKDQHNPVHQPGWWGDDAHKYEQFRSNNRAARRAAARQTLRRRGRGSGQAVREARQEFAKLMKEDS